MRDLRIAARLVRRAGGRDARVLLGVVLGIVLVVVSTLMTLSMPTIVTNQQLRVLARTDGSPDSPLPAGAGPHVLASREILDGRLYSRIALEGATTQSARPPGISRWPAPGHSIVSPALKSFIDAHPDFVSKTRLGVIDPEPIDPRNLIDQDEFRSYTVLDDTPRPRGNVFGMPGETHLETPPNVINAEIATLLGIPAIIFLAQCLRATARRREQRYRSLVMLGVAPRRCAGMYATEMALVTLVGLLGGLLTYSLTQSHLGTSGLLQATWWGFDAGLTSDLIVPLTLLVMGLPAVVHLVARRVMTIRLDNTGREARPRPWMALASRITMLSMSAVAITSTGYLAWIVLQARPGHIYRSDSPVILHTQYAAILAMATTPALAAPAVRAAAALMARTGPAGKTAHRAITTQWVVVRRLIAAVTAAVVVSAMANTFVMWTHLVMADGAPLTYTTITLPRTGPGSSLSPILALHEHLEISLPADTSPPTEDGTAPSITAIRCAPHEEHCSSAPRRGSDTPTNTVFTIALTNGRHATIRAHDIPLDPTAIGIILPLDSTPWIKDLPTDSFQATITTPTGEPTRRVIEHIHHTTPRATIDTGGSEETEQLAREQDILLSTAASGGTLLVLGTFLLVMGQLHEERRRSANALTATGAPQKFLRRTNAIRATLPITIAGLTVAPACTLSAWALTSMFGAEHLTTTQLWWTLTPITTCTLTTWTWAHITGTHHFDRKLLHP